MIKYMYLKKYNRFEKYEHRLASLYIFCFYDDASAFISVTLAKL